MTSSAASSPLTSFRLFEEIGSGSTGVVHRGVMLEDRWGAPAGTQVAVKFLHQKLTGEEGARARFLDEARAGLAISSSAQRHLVRMLAVCEERWFGQDLLFLVMEHVSGPTLRAWLARENAGNEPLVREIGAQLAGALGVLHAGGVVHLDVKPENVILSEGPRAVLMDLGFARELAPGGNRDPKKRTFAGSPVYAAPEILRGAYPTPACDLYSLGVLLFELATRALPFGASEPDALLAEKLEGNAQRASQLSPALSPFLDEVLSSLLAADPALRFPSAEELARVLRAGERSPWWALREREARTVRAKHDDPLPLFGRDEELSLLLQSAHAAFTGEPCFALVVGEAQMGGQRLLLELEHRLASAQPSPQVIEGRCPPADAAVPFAGLLSALERFLGLTRGTRPAHADVARLAAFSSPAAARVLAAALAGTELGDASSDLPTLPRAFCTFLLGLAANRPLVLQLEDFHNVGSATLRALELLFEEPHGRAILPLVLARPSKLVENRALQRFLERLRQRGALREIDLAPLDKPALARALARLMPADLDAEPFVEALLERTGGLPGYVSEVLKALEREGVLAWRDGRLVPLRDIAAIPLPERLVEGARRRRDELPEELKSELDRAAVAGVRFDVELLAEAFGETPLAHAHRLGRLEIGRDVLVPQGSAYRFASQGVHEALYAAIDPEQRRRMHSALADALTARAALADPGTRGSLDIAHHAGAAGEPKRALGWLQALLKRSRRGLSAELATTLCQSALKHVEALGPSDEQAPQRLEWLLHLAEAAGRAGRRSVERSSAERAFREARRLGRRQDQGRALYMLGRHAHRTSNNELALEYLERALEVAPREEAELRLRIRIGMGVAWGYLGLHREARAHLDAAEQDLEGARGSAHLALRVAQARNRLDIHRPGEALDLLEPILPELRRGDDSLLLMRALFQQARALDDTGAYGAALEGVRAALEVEREHGDRRLRATLRSLEGDVRIKLGDFPGAFAALEDALQVARTIGDRYTRVHCWIHLTHAHLSRRNPTPDPRRALSTAKRAVRLADDLDNPRHRAAALSAQARVLLRLDRLDEARELSQRALELHRLTRQDVQRRIAVLYTHWAIVDRRKEPLAERWIERALQLAAGLAKRLTPPERRAQFIREERLVRKILRVCRERGRRVPPILVLSTEKPS